MATEDALNVRIEPSTSARKLDPLGKGSRVVVLGSAVRADGYRWYPIGWGDQPGPETVGWAASGTDSDTWLMADDSPCPPPSLATVRGLPPIERLACFGSASLTITARQAAIWFDAGLGGSCGDEADLPSAWLACGINYNWVNEDGGSDDPFLTLYFDPATGIEPTGLADLKAIGPEYEIRGHFDDPASVGCTRDRDQHSPAYMGAVLTCATRFVVELLRVTAPGKPAPSPLWQCPDVVTFHALGWREMPREDFVPCFGGRELQVVGVVTVFKGPAPTDSPWGDQIVPEWLDGSHRVAWAMERDQASCDAPTTRSSQCGAFSMHAPKAAALPAMTDQWALITGHFDDSAAQTCRSPKMSDAEAIAICRDTFVVTALDPVAAPSSGPAQ